jgi:CheY-like chemotaxis protein
LIVETAMVDLTDEDAQERREIVPGRYARITVADTGGGMPKAIRERVFEPFFTTKEIGKGTGLGLATVYGIVKQHKGYIYAASEPRKGSTFTVYLPTQTASASTGDPDESFSSLPRGSGTVLVVEDDQSVRSLIGEILETLGYTPVIARDSMEALEIIEGEHRRIELLLTDVVMPSMNGKELAELVRTKLPDIRTVFMSGYTDEVICRHGMLDPGILFIQKPVTPQKIAKKLYEAMKQVSRG